MLGPTPVLAASRLVHGWHSRLLLASAFLLWLWVGLVPASLAQHQLVAPNGNLAKFLAYTQDRQPLISAHRGGPKPGFPENAIETFEEALRFAPVLLEMDVRTSKDGVLMLMHDRRLDRTTTGSGLVSETTWADMQSLRLKDNNGAVTPYMIPRLEDVLQWAEGRTILTLDVKRGTRLEDVVALVDAEGATDRAVVITYGFEAALVAQQLSKTLVISATAYEPQRLFTMLRDGLDPKRAMIWTGTRLREPQLYKAIHNAGMRVQMGTLGFNDQALDLVIARAKAPERYLQFYARGVDIISTDRYWAVASVLGYKVVPVAAASN